MRLPPGRLVFHALLACIGATLAALALVAVVPGFGELERHTRDLRLAAFQPPEPRSERVAVIAIDEETIARFAYRSPVDRRFLAELLSAIDRQGARAIGIDLIFDQPTETDKDAILFDTLRSIRTPLAVTYTTNPTIVNARQRAWLEQFVPETLRVDAQWILDPADGTVRAIPEAPSSASAPNALARRLAQLAGASPSADQIPIAWRARPSEGGDPFVVHPAHRVSELPSGTLRDRIVIIGLMLSLTDRHRTPYSLLDASEQSMMPAVMIHAHSVSQLLEARKAPTPSLYQSAASCGALALAGLLLGLLRTTLGARMAWAIAILAGFWGLALPGFRFGIPMLPLIAPTVSFLLTLWAIDFLAGRDERRRRRDVLGAFSRYVSPAIVRRLVTDPRALAIAGRVQPAAFIFTDIEGFTTLAERLDPAGISSLLNEYLDGACQVVFDHEGTIDKFIGDGMMIVFNAPLEQRDYLHRALACALALDRHAEAFRVRARERGIPLGITRIGLHAGPAQIGNFGSRHRMEFTALGDNVNTAARIEAANRQIGTRFCCSESVIKQLADPGLLPVGLMPLRGKQHPVKLYTHQETLGTTDDFARRYKAAYRLLEGGDQAALQAFEALQRDYPESPLARLHRDRILAGNLTVNIGA